VIFGFPILTLKVVSPSAKLPSFWTFGHGSTRFILMRNFRMTSLGNSPLRDPTQRHRCGKIVTLLNANLLHFSFFKPRWTVDPSKDAGSLIVVIINYAIGSRNPRRTSSSSFATPNVDGTLSFLGFELPRWTRLCGMLSTRWRIGGSPSWKLGGSSLLRSSCLSHERFGMTARRMLSQC
jgi:hypothetical protein